MDVGLDNIFLSHYTRKTRAKSHSMSTGIVRRKGVQGDIDRVIMIFNDLKMLQLWAGFLALRSEPMR